MAVTSERHTRCACPACSRDRVAAHFDAEVAAFQRTLAAIRALLEHEHGLSSGQLRRDANGYIGYLVCDTCHDDVQAIARAERTGSPVLGIQRA